MLTNKLPTVPAVLSNNILYICLTFPRVQNAKVISTTIRKSFYFFFQSVKVSIVQILNVLKQTKLLKTSTSSILATIVCYFCILENISLYYFRFAKNRKNSWWFLFAFFFHYRLYLRNIHLLSKSMSHLQGFSSP